MLKNRVPQPQQSPYIYSTDELRRLLDATTALRVANSRLKVMYRTLLMLLYGGGLRVGEALSLTLRDVDLTESVSWPHMSSVGVSFRCPQVMIRRYSLPAGARGGPTNMSSGYSSMSDGLRG